MLIEMQMSAEFFVCNILLQFLANIGLLRLLRFRNQSAFLTRWITRWAKKTNKHKEEAQFLKK